MPLGVLHMRRDGDVSPEYSSLCSYTSNLNGNAWGDTYADHWVNGLLIWVK